MEVREVLDPAKLTPEISRGSNLLYGLHCLVRELQGLREAIGRLAYLAGAENPSLLSQGEGFTRQFQR